MLTIIIISIYLVSLFSSCFLNKWLFKVDSSTPIIPMLWITPIINTFTIFVLIGILISKIEIFTEEYWKNKWN